MDCDEDAATTDHDRRQRDRPDAVWNDADFALLQDMTQSERAGYRDHRRELVRMATRLTKPAGRT